jgi:hypothetical protein
LYLYVQKTYMKIYKVTLREDELTQLNTIVGKGSHKSQKVLNALILPNSNEQSGEVKLTNEQISQILHVSMRNIFFARKGQRGKKCNFLHRHYIVKFPISF